jgi:hypothetical protein
MLGEGGGEGPPPMFFGVKEWSCLTFVEWKGTERGGGIGFSFEIIESFLVVHDSAEGGGDDDVE